MFDIKSFDSFVGNDSFEILTDDGYHKFEGVTRTKLDSPALNFTLNSGDSFICTINHKLYISKDTHQYAKFLNVGEYLYSAYNNLKITDIKEIQVDYVYDVINVNKVNSYLITPSQIKTSNCLYLDEFAFVDNDVEFYTGTYPTVTSGKNTKVIITSTPNGMNMFYKIFSDAENGNNNYKSYKISWREHPERDENWYQETVGNIGEAKFNVEYNCNFLGSSGTLISGKSLETMTMQPPLRESDNNNNYIRVYEEPKDNKIYVSIVDPAEGVGLDYSAISVIDITDMPYKQVFTYRDNTTTPTPFASIVHEVATKYNDSYLLIENNNSAGAIVANSLWYDYEYENMLTTKIDVNSKDTEIGFSSKSVPGIKTTIRTKSIGCTYLKNLIETNQLIVIDYDTISELSTFVRVGKSYEAEKNKNDDLVMTLVIFSWFSSQDYFEDVTGINTTNNLNKSLCDDSMDYVIGFISNGIPDEKDIITENGYTVVYDKGLFN